MAARWTRKELRTRAEQHARLYVEEWAPGDGQTRYRFYDLGTDPGAGSPIGRCLGLSEASQWLDGYIAGQRSK